MRCPFAREENYATVAAVSQFVPPQFQRHLLGLVLAILGLASAVTFHAKPPNETQTQLEAWLKGKPGGIAVVWVDADGVEYFYAGRFSASDKRPIGRDTQFALGSVSKVFTSTLLAESERLGKVSRDDSVARHLLPVDDQAQAALAKITLLTLATHRAGLPYYLPLDFGSVRSPADNPFSTWDRADVVAGLRRLGPRAPVGRAMVYSNLGAALLGEALGSAWELSYTESLITHVFLPLGMKSTSVGLPGTPSSSLLAPAHANGKSVSHWSLLAFAPAGAVRSTAGDMALFMEAALGFSDSPHHESISETLKVQNEAEQFSSHIGLAWFMVEQRDRQFAWHGGATAGTHAFVALDLTSRHGVTILANSDQEVASLGFALIGMQPPRNQRQDPPVIPNAIDYVGRYAVSPSQSFEITERKGALYMRKSEWRASEPLRPVRADCFAINLAPAEITFQRDPDGKVTAVVEDWAGSVRSASREQK